MQRPPGKPLLDEIRSRGYTLGITLNDDGTTTLTAVHPITGVRHAATAPGDGIEAARYLFESVRRDDD